MARTTVAVKGLRDFQAGLRKIDSELGPELRKGLNEVADVVASAAQRKVPTRTGRARASIKAGSSARGAALRVGGTKAPYYPWLDFGGKVGRGKSVTRPFRTSGRYIYPTLADHSDDVLRKLDEIIDRLTKQAGF